MRPAPFFLVKPRQTDPNFGHFRKRKAKRNDAAKLFFTLINSFNVKNEQSKSISRNSRFAGVSFLLFSGPSFRVSLHGKRYGKVYESTVNSLIATTSRKRPPPVSDHFVNIRFCLSVKYCFKNSLVNHYLNFLNDCDHFLVQKFDVFFCFLFPVSDHPTGSLIIVTKTMARMAQKFSFISFFFKIPLTKLADRL